MNREDSGSASFFKELGCFMKPYCGKYTISVLLSVLSVAAKLLSFAFVGVIAGLLFIPEVDFGKVIFYALAAVLCKVINALALNFSTWISHKAAYLTLKDIRNALADKLMRLPMGYFEEHGSGRLKTMLVDRIEGMEKTLAHMLPELTANLLVPVALMVWMFFIDWRLALTAFIWIVAGLSVTCGMMKGYTEKYAGQIAAFKAMNQAVVEYVGGIEVIKNFGRADECYQKYENAVYNHADYNTHWQRQTQTFTSLGMAIAPFSIFPILITGLLFFAEGTLAPGTMILMLLLTLGIFGPIMNASGYFDQLAQMGTNAKEIRDVLDCPELKRGTREPQNMDIKLSHVCFSYTKDSKPALCDVSLSIPAGSMLALVGPSGSGKSTIAKLLAGFWDAESGDILIGGHSIREYSQEELNRRIAYVEQETYLFDKSIMDNIRMGAPKVNDAAVIEAAKRAGCDGFICALPDGYQTLVGAAGGRLSGGERQRIAIARAMMKDASIMILDEATASSDPENEASIQTALSAAAKGKTLIVVAHRLATIVSAQQIAFVKNGKITAIGTHDELLAKCPEYNIMWRMTKEG